MYSNLSVSVSQKKYYDDVMKCKSILKCFGIYQHIYDYLSQVSSSKKQQYVKYAMLINKCGCKVKGLD